MRRGVVAGDFNLAAHHLAAARFRGEEHHQEMALANLRLDFPRPGLADGEPLIDEHGVARSREAGDQFVCERLVRLDVPLVAEEDSGCDVPTAWVTFTTTPRSGLAPSGKPGQLP